jgi:hypothetical protein
MAEHYFDIFIWILEGFKLTDKDGAIFKLFTDIVDGLSGVDCFA